MSKGLQDYQRAIQGLQSSRDSVQSYIDNYDSDFFQNWRDNLKPVKDVVGGVQKVVDEFDTAYLGGKILHATYKGLKKKLTKKGDDPGDEEGKAEKSEDNTGEEEENTAPNVEDTPEGSTGAVQTENVNPPKESIEKSQPDEPSAEAVGGEPDETEPTLTLDKTPEEDTRLFDNLKNAPEPTKENFGLSEASDPSEVNTYSLVAPEDLSSSDAVLGGANNAYTGSIKGFNSDFTQPDEFDLPSGLGDTQLFGQGESTAVRLANNNLIGGGRAGPEILGQQTGGGFGPIEDPLGVPKIQTQGLSSEQEALQLFPKERPPAEQETIVTDDSPIFPGGTQQGPDSSTGTQGKVQVKSNTGDADGDMLNQSDRLKNLASGDDVSPSSLIEQGKNLAGNVGDDAGGFLSSASDLISGGAEAIGGAIDAGIGVASGVLDTLGPIGLIGGLGLGLYEAFKPPPKPKKPPPQPKITTFASKGEMVLPSYDSVVDAPASSTAF